MKKLIFILFLGFAGILANAQYYTVYSQNMFNQLSYNPAFAGMSKGYNADMGYRSQFAESPAIFPSLLLNADAAIPVINSGLGITEFNLNGSFWYINEVKLSYSYHINLGTGILAVGSSIGYYNLQFTKGWQNSNLSTYDIGLGLYYSTPRGFYVGLSSSKPNDQFYTSPVQESVINIPRQYYLTASYPIHADAVCDFIPDAFVQYSFYNNDNLQLQTDIRLQGKTAWIGMGLRTYPYPAGITPAQFIAIIGIMHEFKDGSTIKLGYSYDFPSVTTTPPWATSNNGMHEIHLMFCIKQKPVEKTKSE